MVSLFGIFVDILLVIVFVATVFHYINKGFVTSFINLVSTLGSFIISFIISNALSPVVFNTFFRQGMLDSTQESLNSYGTYTTDNFLDGILSVFPQTFQSSVQSSIATIINENAAGAANNIVDSVVAPIFTSFINIVIFIVFFIICMVLFKFIGGPIGKAVNRLPIVGGVNKLLGGVMGIFGGIINMLLVMLLFWFLLAITQSSLAAFSATDLSQSFFFRIFITYNPFF